MINNILNKDIANSNVFINKNTIKIVNDIIDNAILQKASDIHILDYYGKCIVEYRVDGILKRLEDNSYISSEIIARIKIMAKMNVAEKRLTQDGSISYNNFDLRVCVIPTISGESAVIRILNSRLDDISLKSLGFNEKNIDLILNGINKPYGLVLITGPTGSGKSTTLLSLTKMLNNGKRKIISIEDPVENKVQGIIQVQINENIGLDFPTVLRSSLRADPDIIIVGEIRDEITAEIAIRASLTGHLVLATLHTNDSISTFVRLIDMKIPKYLLLDSINLIISQRLLTKNDNKNIVNRLAINEALLMTSKVKDIFNKYNLKSEILSELKKIEFKTMEEDLNEKGYNL
ncbi:GspE/PulE family protein [Caviibacter abscessus]|uniref:GspE/PulE family protein n=1 Tax=Caviibacter abscessus TaxID=1766719 RepID=UPI000835580E|nr:GspE/PulE family protein [Caviibacter abscessus]